MHRRGPALPNLLDVALKRKWVILDLDSRELTVTGVGRREMRTRFGLRD